MCGRNSGRKCYANTEKRGIIMRVSSDDRAGVFTSTTQRLNLTIKGIYKLMTFPTSSHTERPAATILKPGGLGAHVVLY